MFRTLKNGWKKQRVSSEKNQTWIYYKGVAHTFQSFGAAEASSVLPLDELVLLLHISSWTVWKRSDHLRPKQQTLERESGEQSPDPALLFTWCEHKILQDCNTQGGRRVCLDRWKVHVALSFFESWGVFMPTLWSRLRVMGIVSGLSTPSNCQLPCVPGEPWGTTLVSCS